MARSEQSLANAYSGERTARKELEDLHRGAGVWSCNTFPRKTVRDFEQYVIEMPPPFYLPAGHVVKQPQRVELHVADPYDAAIAPVLVLLDFRPKRDQRHSVSASGVVSPRAVRKFWMQISSYEMIFREFLPAVLGWSQHYAEPTPLPLQVTNQLADSTTPRYPVNQPVPRQAKESPSHPHTTDFSLKRSPRVLWDSLVSSSRSSSTMIDKFECTDLEYRQLSESDDDDLECVPLIEDTDGDPWDGSQRRTTQFSKCDAHPLSVQPPSLDSQRSRDVEQHNGGALVASGPILLGKGHRIASDAGGYDTEHGDVARVESEHVQQQMGRYSVISAPATGSITRDLRTTAASNDTRGKTPTSKKSMVTKVLRKFKSKKQ